jgi:hypothetical protein
VAAEPSATGDLRNLIHVTNDDKGIQKRLELTSRSKAALTLLDTSLCPDKITFVPNIQDDQEMHFELELVVVTRAIDKIDLSPEEASSCIVGYTLAVTASVHPLGKETSEPGPGYYREVQLSSKVSLLTRLDSHRRLVPIRSHSRHSKHAPRSRLITCKSHCEWP